MTTDTRCRHTTSWLLAGARVEWCYACGAMRTLRQTGVASCAAASEWQRPVGPDRPNPWERFDRGVARMEARRR